MFTTPFPFHHHHHRQHPAAHPPRPNTAEPESSQIMSPTTASDSYVTCCPAQGLEQQSLSLFQQTVLEEQEIYFKTFPAARLALEEEKACIQSQSWRPSYLNVGYLPGWGFQLAGVPSVLVDPASHSQTKEESLEQVPIAVQDTPSYGLDQSAVTQHGYHPSLPQIQSSEHHADNYAPSPEYSQSPQETGNRLPSSSTDIQSFDYDDPYGVQYDQVQVDTTPVMDSLPSPLSQADSGSVHGTYPSSQQPQQQAFYLPTAHQHSSQSFSPPAINDHLHNYAGDLDENISASAPTPASVHPIKTEPEQQVPLFSQQQQPQPYEHDHRQQSAPIDIEQHPQNQISYVSQPSPQQYQQQDQQQRHETRHYRRHQQQQQQQYSNTHLVSASPTRRRHHHSTSPHGHRPYTHPQQTHVHRRSAESAEVMFGGNGVIGSSSLQGENQIQIQRMQSSSPIEWTNASGSIPNTLSQQHVLQDSGSGVAPEAHAAAVHVHSTSAASSSSSSSSPPGVVVLSQHRVHPSVNATATATLVQNGHSQNQIITAQHQHQHQHQHHVALPAATASTPSSSTSSIASAASVPSQQQQQQQQQHQPFPIQIPIVVTPPIETAATRASPTTSSRRNGDKKPMLACIFCRGRKIACGLPSKDGDGKTCNQCQRRSLKCVYPTESRRGMRKKTPHSTTLTLNPMPKVVVTSKKR